MAQTTVTVWFDAEGDFLEVLFSDAPGIMRQTAVDSVMERVDEKGAILGFTIQNVSQLAREHRPLLAQLSA
jgi:uncharacterized protein YuzE